MAEQSLEKRQRFRVPFVGIINSRAAAAATKDQRYVNVFVETIENPINKETLFFLRKRPGVVYHSQPSGTTGTGRGIHSWRGDLYSVIGNAVYKNTTYLGIVSNSSGLVHFTETLPSLASPLLVLNNGQYLYTIDTSGTLTQVTDADYPSTNNTGQVVFLDTYTIVAQTNGRIWNSAVNDPTSWGSADYLNAQSFPDELVAIARQNNLVVALGKSSTEFFYNAGNASPGSFMASLEQGLLQVGCASENSVVQRENFLVWVSGSDTGGYSVYLLDGVTNARKISTDPLEQILNAEGTSISTAGAFSLRIAGHFFYILTLTSQNRTFVYDYEQDFWTEWSTGSSGKFDYVAAAEHNNTVYLQHNTNGKIYTFSPTTYQDDSATIYVSLVTAKMDFNWRNRKFYHSLELIGDKESSTCNVDVQYSDDDYNNFSTARSVDMSSSRPILFRLGSARRRAWKFSHTANTPLRLEGFDIEVSSGVY